MPLQPNKATHRSRRASRTSGGGQVGSALVAIPLVASRRLYESLYCARGNAENLIKLHKTQLASDRTSCRSPLANQMRLILQTAAYWLIHMVRAGIPGTHKLAPAEFATILLRLFKVAARVSETATRVRLAFAATWPRGRTVPQPGHRSLLPVAVAHGACAPFSPTIRNPQRLSSPQADTRSSQQRGRTSLPHHVLPRHGTESAREKDGLGPHGRWPRYWSVARTN